jgi:hypothetical protein
MLCLSVVSLTIIPKGIGLYFSVTDFDKFVQENEGNTYHDDYLRYPIPAPVPIGMYPVYDYAVGQGGGVCLVTRFDHSFDYGVVSGFAYKPSVEMPGIERHQRRFQQLWGDWSVFDQTLKY